MILNQYDAIEHSNNTSSPRVLKFTRYEKSKAKLNSLQKLIKVIKQRFRSNNKNITGNKNKNDSQKSHDLALTTSKSDNNNYDEVYNSEFPSSSSSFSKSDNNNNHYNDIIDSRSTIVLSDKERLQLRRFSQDMILWKQQNHSFASTTSKTSCCSDNNDNNTIIPSTSSCPVTATTTTASSPIITPIPTSNNSSKSITINTTSSTTLITATPINASTITDERVKRMLMTEHHQIKYGLYGSYLTYA